MFNNSLKILTEEKNLDVLTKLKFISTILPNQKINVQQLKAENNNVFTPLKRMFYGETRSTTLNFITSTVEKSFDIIKVYSSSEKKSEILLCNNITTDLIKCIDGLHNLQKTYKDDNIVVCSITSIIENIKAKLIELKEQSPNIFIPVIKFEDNFDS